MKSRAVVTRTLHPSSRTARHSSPASSGPSTRDPDKLYFAIHMEQDGKSVGAPRLVGFEGKRLFAEKWTPGAPLPDYRLLLQPKEEGAGYGVWLDLELPSGPASTANEFGVDSGSGEIGALLEQASLQREANEDVAEHISALTAIIADLGQTVGMLAVAAAHKAQHSGLPTRPTFTPPPRSEPAAAAPHVPSARSAALPQVDPVGVTASRIEPASSRVEPTAPTSPALSPAAANQPRGRADLSLSHAITHEPAHRRPIHLRLAQEAAERTRVQEALEGDPDDDLGTDPVDESDDPRPRRRLPPCTDLVQHEEQERDHDA